MRVWSEYRHCSTKMKVLCWGSFSAINRTEYAKIKNSPREFLTHWNYKGHNKQAKMLLGDDWSDELEKTTEGSKFLIEKGIKRLHELAFIGLHEKLLDTMRLFCRTFYLTCNTTLLIKILKHPYNPQRTLALSEEIMSIIVEKNSIDLAIYDAANKIFQERMTYLPTLPSSVYESAKFIPYGRITKRTKFKPVTPAKTLQSVYENTTIKPVANLILGYSEISRRRARIIFRDMYKNEAPS